MFRVNWHYDAVVSGHPIPKWINELYSDAVKAYANEWKISEKRVKDWISNQPILDDDLGEDRVKEVFAFFGVHAKRYSHQSLPSHGFLIDENCGKSVEYKLKYGGA